MTGGGPANSTALISWFAYAEIFKALNLGTWGCPGDHHRPDYPGSDHSLPAGAQN